MSCPIDLELIPHRIKKQISSDLKVVSKPTPYSGGETILCFDTTTVKKEDDDDEDIVLVMIPFAYFYHHFSPICKYNYPNDWISYPRTSNFNFTGKLNKIQEEVKSEVYEILNRTHSIIISLFTGAGKTAFTNFLISKLQYKTLVVCHRLNIIDQWVYAVNKFCPDAKVQIVTSSNKMNPDCDIYIINVTSICKRDPNDFKDIGILVVDEADKTICTDGGSKSLFVIKPKYAIALTATPHRTDRKSEVLELYFGPEIVQRKLFRPFNAYFINTGYKIKAQSTRMGRLDWDHVLRTQCEHEDRNDLIVDILRYFKNRKFLVLCKRTDQTNRLVQKLLSYGEDVDKYISTQKVCNYDCRVLVSTYSKSGVGFDHPTLDGLIIASDVEEGIEQYLGRVFRREDSQPMVFDLVDNLHTLFKHFVTRRTLYESVGGDVKEMSESFPEFYKWRMKN